MHATAAGIAAGVPATLARGRDSSRSGHDQDAAGRCGEEQWKDADVAIEVGQEAPDFTLPDENNNQVTLSELRGTPVVLMFYVFDFSGTCTAELCEVRDNYQSWMDKGATVYGISRDSRFSHAVYKEKENLPYSLLADTRGEVAKQYGVWNDAGLIAERGTFVIDSDGKIAYAIHNTPANARDHAEVEAHIK